MIKYNSKFPIFGESRRKRKIKIKYFFSNKGCKANGIGGREEEMEVEEKRKMIVLVKRKTVSRQKRKGKIGAKVCAEGL